METLHKQVSKSHMRKYTVLRDFTIGQIEVPVEVGDELLYAKGKLDLYGQEYKVTNLEFALNAGWIELAEGEEPDPVVSRVLANRNSYKLQDTPKVTEALSAPQTNVAEGVDSVNGVEVLPDDWDTLHWTKKRAYIVKMTDKELLEDIKSDENDKMQQIIQKRIDDLTDFSTGKSRVSMLGTNTGTPLKPLVGKLEVAEDTMIATSFGKPKNKRMDMTKEPMDVTVSPDTDNEISSVFG